MRNLGLMAMLLVMAFGCGAPADQAPEESTTPAEPTPISQMDFEDGQAVTESEARTMDFEQGDVPTTQGESDAGDHD